MEQKIFNYLDTLDLTKEERNFIAGTDKEVIKTIFSVDMSLEDVKETIKAYSDDIIDLDDVTTVNIFGLDMTVDVIAKEVTEYISEDVFYKQAFQLDDLRWIAYDNAVNAWVMLG